MKRIFRSTSWRSRSAPCRAMTLPVDPPSRAGDWAAIWGECESGGGASGPPVQSVLVAEIYGPDYDRQSEIAREVRQMFETTAGVVDVDDYLEADQVKYVFHRRSRKGGACRYSVGGNRPDSPTRLGG